MLEWSVVASSVITSVHINQVRQAKLTTVGIPNQPAMDIMQSSFDGQCRYISHTPHIPWLPRRAIIREIEKFSSSRSCAKRWPHTMSFLKDIQQKLQDGQMKFDLNLKDTESKVSNSNTGATPSTSDLIFKVSVCIIMYSHRRDGRAHRRTQVGKYDQVFALTQ